jgi:hypothetical protein
VHHVPFLIGDELHLDVPRILDELLDVDPGVVERGQRLLPRGGQGVLEFLARAHNAQPASAPAGQRLDHHRIADFLGDLERGFVVLDHAVAARHGGDFGLLGQLAGRGFVAQQTIDSADGPMNSMFESRHISANWAFSARNP